MKKAHIVQYRDFWDIPRIFIASFGQDWVLFDCKFNEEIEDFETKYRVFLMPTELQATDLTGSWKELPEKALRFLGEIQVDDVEFDESRRKYINSEIISNLLTARRDEEVTPDC